MVQELKVYHCNEWHNEYTEFYRKYEVDALLAEKDAENESLLQQNRELCHAMHAMYSKEAYDKLKTENARLKKELEGPGVYRIKNPCTPEESETIRLALEKSNPVHGICREFHEGCRVARSVLFYALGIAATYQAKYFRLEFQSDRGALVRRKQRQAARLLDKARSGFYMEEETITTAQDALNGRR